MENEKYTIGLVDVKWSMGRVILLVALAFFSFIMRRYVSTNPFLPFWLDEFSPMLAAAIDGPVFGAAVSALWLVIETAINGFSGHTALTILMYAIISAIFGAMFRLGFFGSKKTAPIAFIVLVITNTLIAVATSMAIFGESTFNNIITSAMLKMFERLGVHGLSDGIISYMAANIVDKLIVMPAILLIIKYIPDKAAEFFSINKHIPVTVIVDSDLADKFYVERAKQNSEAAK